MTTHGNSVCEKFTKVLRNDSDGGRTYNCTVEVYEIKRYTNYTKGNKTDPVTANTRNAYPDNDVRGNVWYVYVGLT